MTVSPLPAGTDVGDSPGGKFQSRTGLFDAAGADALGLVTASPAALSMLGRLKAIQDLLTLTNGYVDGLEGFLDQVETLITGTNTALGTLNGYTDGIEGLLIDLRTLLTTQSGYQDGVEALLGTGNTLTALTAPADDAFAIVPSDGADLAQVPKSLLVAVAGNLAFRGTGGITVTIPVIAGQVLPIRARRVMATGTTATVVGLI